MGVIQVLEENGIGVDVISGTSMGAYVGALWAAGYNGTELAAFAAEIRRPKDLWSRLDLAIPPVRGLFFGTAIRMRLAAALRGATFADLARELYVVATNLDTYERCIFSGGDVALAVHASFAIPGVCVPVEIDGRRYVDGGVVDPLPCGVLERAGCDVILAVSVVPSMEEIACGLTETVKAPSRNPLRRMFAAVNRSVNVFAAGNVVDTMRRSVTCAEIRLARTSARKAHVLIRPPVQTAAWHDYHRFQDYIESGRQAAEAQLPAIRARLSVNPSTGGDHETNYPALSSAIH